jgi:hypothetical protein
MAIQYINLGTNPNDGTGDDLRSAFLKVNDNFQLLATIGGETNIGANIGGGSGQVYASKTNETLNFRTIAAGTGITVNQSAQTITIASSFTAPASITKIYDDNNSLYETTIPGASLKIKGSGFVTTQISANELTINGTFSVVQDTLPLLGGNLNLNGFNVSGLGNISNTGSITADVLTIGRSSGSGNYPGVATIAGTLTVNGATSLSTLSATSITTTSGITAPSFTTTSGVFTGNLTGNSTGIHYGNVAIKGVGINPDVVVVNTAINPAAITGSHYGTFSGDLTGNLIAPGIDTNGQSISGVGTISLDGVDTPGNMVLTVNGAYHGGDFSVLDLPSAEQGAGSTLLNMAQQAFGLSEALRLRSTSFNSNQITPRGTGIRFESVNVIDTLDVTYDPLNPPTAPEYLLNGYIGLLNYDDGVNSSSVHSSFVVEVRTGDVLAENYLKKIIIARGNGRVSVSRLDIFDGIIEPRYEDFGGTVSQNPYDLVLRTSTPSNYINFYGTYDPAYPDEGRATGATALSGYSFPKLIGAPGEVLTVQNGTNLLTWSLPSGGGGAATAFLNLTDVDPVSFGGQAGKVVRVNATNDGLEFSNSIEATVTGNLVGNASTATALQTTRTINGFDFNGTQNITIDTRQIEELTESAAFVSVIGSGGIAVTSTTFTTYEYNIIVGSPGAGNFRVGMYVTGTNISGNLPRITNIVLSGGSNNNDRIITLTVSFDSQIVVAQSGLTIFGRVDNQWFNLDKARESFSVTPGLALTYSQASGAFNLNEAVTSLADTLVKRDANSNVFVNTLNATTLQKNSGDTVLTIASPLVLSSTLNTGANNITTTGTVSTGFLTLTGTGTQTITSTAQIVLSPGTYVDVSGKKITNLSIVAPTLDSDAASKKYVDDTTVAVFNASFQQLPISGDTGGTLNVPRSSTLTVSGGNNISTVTTGTGIQIGLKSTLSGITISGNLPVTGGGIVTATQIKGGNVKLDGNAVTQTVVGSDLNLVPGATGGAVLITDTDLKLVNSKLSITGYDQMEFSANTLEQTISLVTATTFIRTLNWVDDSAGLAYAELPNGSTGQIKMIIMSSRGTYGNALDTRPRYLVLRGNISGSSRSINISASDPNGSATFIFLNNYWWRIANVA